MFGFSHQNNIKVKSRARLSSSIVDQLMKVYLNGEHYKSFDYKKDLTRWMDRRIEGFFRYSSACM